MSSEDTLRSAAIHASYNSVAQLVFRLISFCINAIVIRLISPEVLGVANIRLLLLYTTSIFVVCEPFRRSCTSKDLKSANIHTIINSTWLIPLIGSVIISLLMFIWIVVLEKPEEMPHYASSVAVFATSAFIEMCYENLVILSKMYLLVKLKAVFEGVSTLFKALVIVGTLLINSNLGLFAFALGQLAYSTVCFIQYYVYFGIFLRRQKTIPFKSIKETLPHKVPGKTNFFNYEFIDLAFRLFRQTILILILTQGEYYAMTFFYAISFSDQGAYDIISNLVALPARFIFAPIEESCYLFFSHILKRGEKAFKQERTSVILAHKTLCSALRFVTIISYILIVFGYVYTPLLLLIYGGANLSQESNITLMRTFCWYTLIICINGPAEGFTHAVMSKKNIDRYNYWLALFSGLFLLISFPLTSFFGTVGFVLANTFNMCCRISHSLHFIYNFFKDLKEPGECTMSMIFRSMLPSLSFALSLITTFHVNLFCKFWIDWKISSGGSNMWLLYSFHIFIGAIGLFIVLCTLYFTEHGLIAFGKILFGHKLTDDGSMDESGEEHRFVKEEEIRKIGKFEKID